MHLFSYWAQEQVPIAAVNTTKFNDFPQQAKDKKGNRFNYTTGNQYFDSLPQKHDSGKRVCCDCIGDCTRNPSCKCLQRYKGRELL